MKKNIKEIYLLESLFFILVIISNILKINYALEALFILFAIIFYFKLGFVKDNAYEKGNVVRIVISTLLGFTILMYGLGVFTGFYKSSVWASLKGFAFGVVLLSSTIIAEEIIRYIVAKNCTKTKKPLVILTIIFSILNIVTQINISALNDRWTIFVFISTFALPIITREILCSYLAYKCGITPNLVFRLLMEVVFHMLPIIPNLGDYLYSVIRILIPALIYFFSSKVFRYHAKSGAYTKKASRRIIIIPVIAFSIVLVYLVSGIFKYKMIAIGSGSMEPIYYMGDAVIYEKKTADDIKPEDILVFNQGHIVITHRVMTILRDERGKKCFITKGDNNAKKDDYIVQEEDVLGIVRVPVKYVGYPTLWINKLIER